MSITNIVIITTNDIGNGNSKETVRLIPKEIPNQIAILKKK
ncbi:MAG TPA: hypothetical protein VFR94_19590 [Nitrososphaeraceae archaeon]|nr:hypothetical protein [Nitrososphaeraceae archaeon]